jgi:hypothetical protein
MRLLGRRSYGLHGGRQNGGKWTGPSPLALKRSATLRARQQRACMLRSARGPAACVHSQNRGRRLRSCLLHVPPPLDQPWLEFQFLKPVG